MRLLVRLIANAAALAVAGGTTLAADSLDYSL